MSSAAPKLISLCGFPEEGEYVPVDTRAEAILIRQGWIPPAPPDPVRQVGRCGHHSRQNISCQRDFRHDGLHGRGGIFWDDDGWGQA